MHSSTTLLPLLAGAASLALAADPGPIQRAHVYGRQEESSFEPPQIVTETSTIILTDSADASNTFISATGTRTLSISNPFRPTTTVPACVRSLQSFIVSPNTPTSGPAAGSPIPDPTLLSFFNPTVTPEINPSLAITAAGSSLCSSIYSSLASASVPAGPIATAYTSYRSAYFSWASKAGPFATSLASACRASAASEAATATSTRRSGILPVAGNDEDFWAGQALLKVATDVEGCLTAYNILVGVPVTLPATGIETVTSTATNTATKTEGDGAEETEGVTTSSSTAGAAWARETGFVAAAAAAAGIVGLVGAL
ncbi:hypothetical protein QBC35DRAFT_510043 [Podospora australis]|uniref:Uncharacterized protein n=1 Tax=Podospora australis TaxID=1536484 RepID=A0AAN6WJ72_9PEZI|nr:hypothetical protein QBC35DRAFT_510043 [Podospora australis]